MLAIPDYQVDRAIFVIDSCGAAEFLEEGLALAPQGHPGTLPLRTWLIGAYLGIETRGSYKSTTIAEVLTKAISHQMQCELGIRFRDKHGEMRTISKSTCDYHARMLPKRLAYTASAAGHYDLDIGQAEMDRRQAVILGAVDRILDGSLVGPVGPWYALDGSNTWSWGRSKRVLEDKVDVRDKEEVADDAHARTRDEVADGVAEPSPSPLPDRSDADAPPTQSKNWDYDAAIGSMTHKLGKRAPFCGFVLDAAVSVPPPNGEKRPVVLARLVVSPASTDVVAPSLTMLDSLMETTNGVTDILVDRHYSFKRVDRWADELRARKISQHFDLREGEQGFIDVNGMKMVGGWMHCPATPDHLANVERPGPGASPDTLAEFRAKIAERRSWAMDRTERVNAKGRTRWQCPAVAARRGCALKDGTVDVAKSAGLPIVANPPAADEQGPCCTNDTGTATDRSDRMRKHQQPYYWGSDEWQAAYDLRTYVEGFFGSLKNADTEGVRRGFTKFRGLVMMNLGLALAAAVCNVRHQRKFWHDRDDRPDHPLLTPDPEFHGWTQLTRAAVDELDRGWQPHDGDGPAAA